MVWALAEEAVQLAQPQDPSTCDLPPAIASKDFQTDGQRWISKTSILLKEPVDRSKESRQDKNVKYCVQVLV
jgi:hypothetical protein